MEIYDMTMHGKAIDVVIEELDKLAMCKRGVFGSEFHRRRAVLNKRERSEVVPTYTKVELNRIFAKNRKRLLKILKFSKSKDLVRADSFSLNMFTTESRAAYEKAKKKTLQHSDYAAWKLKALATSTAYKTLRVEEDHRLAELEDDFKRAKMDFISEAVSLKNFQEVYDALEQKEW